MEEGIKKAAEAFVIQYKVDKNVEQLIKEKVPSEYVAFVQRYAVWGKIILEQRVEYKWNF